MRTNNSMTQCRTQQSRLLRATLRNIRPAEKWESGIYLGRRSSYSVDLKRMTRVVERTVRGLFSHEFGHCIPADYEVDTKAVDGFRAGDINAILGVSKVADAALAGGLRRVAGGAFEYAVSRAIDRPDATVWVLRFYGKVYFIARTGPPEKFSTQVPAVSHL